ncbi:MAG: hypothetical protein Q8L14_29710 [Myxococcales bacterium]|nr:hypothetical protein [Myxococcales bacterium]
MSKRTKYQARRPVPPIRTVARSKQPAAFSLGDLIAAAYDTIGETRAVARLLSSNALATRIGRHIVVG